MKSYLRQADENDKGLLYEWANEAEVRKNSFSTVEISYEEHQRWYRQILSRSDCRQYIYMQDDKAVGQVRLTISGNKAEVSYSICAEKRCMGYGKMMLQLLCEQVKKDLPEIKTLIAKVKPDNIASRKVFMDIGYLERYDVFEMELNDEKNSLYHAEIPNTGGITPNQ